MVIKVIFRKFSHKNDIPSPPAPTFYEKGPGPTFTGTSGTDNFFDRDCLLRPAFV